MRFNKQLLFAVAIVFFILNVCCGNTLAKNYTIATASVGGTWYPMGVGMGNLWTEKLKEDGIAVSAQSSGGSSENVQMLQNGEAEIIYVTGILAQQAYYGTNTFEGKPHDKLRSVGFMSHGPLNYVIRKDKVKTGNVSDIDGLHFSCGPAGSGGQHIWETIVKKALGLKVSEEYLGFTPAAEAIRNGQLDGSNFDASPPVAVLIDLFANPGIDVQQLFFSQEDVDRMNETAGSTTFYLYTIEAGIYPKQDKDIITAAYGILMAMSIDVPEDDVYKLLETLYSNVDYMIDIHPSCESISLENSMKGLSIPLHPGAIRYYQDQGIEIPNAVLQP